MPPLVVSGAELLPLMFKVTPDQELTLLEVIPLKSCNIVFTIAADILLSSNLISPLAKLEPTTMPTFQDMSKTKSTGFDPDQSKTANYKFNNQLEKKFPLGEDDEEYDKQYDKNMSQGFVNESLSPREIKRKNKEDRLNKKLGRV